jgi:chemotaxis protein CheX
MSNEISLAPRLDLSAAQELLATLSTRKDSKVILDMSEVSHLGSLCLQVMIAAARAARNDGRTLIVKNTSDRVRDQMRVMGMTPETIGKGDL